VADRRAFKDDIILIAAYSALLAPMKTLIFKAFKNKWMKKQPLVADRWFKEYLSDDKVRKQNWTHNNHLEAKNKAFKDECTKYQKMPVAQFVSEQLLWWFTQK
jgi:hypothetical protein